MTTQDFEFLYKENASKMIGYCCRNFNVDAESVVQDAFNIIWKKREASNSNSNSFAWLTFKNVLMTALRSNRRRLIREDQYHSMSDKVYLNKEEDPRLVFLTNLKLKPKDQELFNMVFLKNKKHLEVAKILKTTENNVNVKVFRLKNKILKMYQEKTVQND
jgi:RNA polymerase sigma factor (sigma-70 family)